MNAKPIEHIERPTSMAVPEYRANERGRVWKTKPGLDTASYFGTAGGSSGAAMASAEVTAGARLSRLMNEYRSEWNGDWSYVYSNLMRKFNGIPTEIRREVTAEQNDEGLNLALTFKWRDEMMFTVRFHDEKVPPRGFATRAFPPNTDVTGLSAFMYGVPLIIRDILAVGIDFISPSAEGLADNQHSLLFFFPAGKEIKEWVENAPPRRFEFGVRRTLFRHVGEPVDLETLSPEQRRNYIPRKVVAGHVDIVFHDMSDEFWTKYDEEVARISTHYRRVSPRERLHDYGQELADLRHEYILLGGDENGLVIDDVYPTVRGRNSLAFFSETVDLLDDPMWLDSLHEELRTGHWAGIRFERKGIQRLIPARWAKMSTEYLGTQLEDVPVPDVWDGMLDDFLEARQDDRNFKRLSLILKAAKAISHVRGIRAVTKSFDGIPMKDELEAAYRWWCDVVGDFFETPNGELQLRQEILDALVLVVGERAEIELEGLTVKEWRNTYSPPTESALTALKPKVQDDVDSI